MIIELQKELTELKLHQYAAEAEREKQQVEE